MPGAVNNENVALSENAEKYKSSCSVVADTTESDNQESLETSATKIDYNLNKFHLKRVLNNNTRNKSIALLGIFPDLSDSDMAVVIFEKEAFQESDVATTEKNEKKENGNKEHLEENAQTMEEEESTIPSFFCDDLIVKTEFINNIYGSYRCTPPPKLSGVKATVVYPATDKHVEKYSVCQKFLINETPNFYEKITLPYITSSQFSLEWVYNILEHKQESDRIIAEDPDPENGFILLPDLKWDGHNVENLYALAIANKRDIKSLRDLDASHLPLLHNIRNRASEAIESRYGILSNQLRIYIHYQPSFYHFHVHINPLRNDAPGIWCEKSHMIDTVINNLELLPDYYKKATLPFVLYEGNKLLELYGDKLAIRKSITHSADRDNIMEDVVKANKQKIEIIAEEDNDEGTAVTN